jgi:YD repeat-containing protein
VNTRRAIASLLFPAFLAPSAISYASDVVENEGGQVAEETQPDGSRAEYQYDAEGRVISVRHPDGTVTRYWYDEEGRQHEVTPES